MVYYCFTNYLYIYVCVRLCVWYDCERPLGASWTSSQIFLHENVTKYSNVADLIDLMGLSRFIDNLFALINSISLLCFIHLRDLIITWIQMCYQVSVWRAHLINCLIEVC